MNPAPAVSADLLVGNAFPLSLVRRRVVIQPVPSEVLRAVLGARKVHSFWGHDSTLAAVNAWLGVDLAPKTARPVLTCDPATGHPVLEGCAFAECWVVSPDYQAGFRPAPNAEVPPEKIRGWQVLRLTWG